MIMKIAVYSTNSNYFDMKTFFTKTIPSCKDEWKNISAKFSNVEFNIVTQKPGFFLADDEDLQMRKDTEENRNAFKDNFLDSSSDNSIKVSDITSVSSLSSGLKQNFDTGVNPLSSPYGDYASEHMQDYYNRLEGVKK